MSRYRVPAPPGPDVGLAYTQTGVVSWLYGAAPPPPPAPGDIVVSVMVEYVDATGVRQSVNPLEAGVTIIGVAPLLMTIDATGTRAPTAFAAYTGGQAAYLPASYPAGPQQTAMAAEAFATLACGYRISYGGGAGSGNWAYPENAPQSKNEDSGFPLWPGVLTELGTHTISVRVMDPQNRVVTVSFPVTVVAPAAVVHIPVSAGSWPALVSNRRYTLDAGANYTGFGQLNTGNLHNVSFEKVGAGADPIVSTWAIDPRSKFGETVSFPTRARHVRVLGINVQSVQEGQRGFDYCGLIVSTPRAYSSGGQRFFFNEGNAIEQSACRYSNGFFLVGCELNNVGTSTGFTLFGTWKHLHILGSNINATDTGPTTWLVIRAYGTKHTYRRSKVRISHAETSACGTPLSILSETGLVETTWPANDRPAAIGSPNHYGLRCEHSFAFRCQFYDATSSRANAVFSTGGNPNGLELVRPWLVGTEDCVYFPAGDVGMLSSNTQLAGRGGFVRNARRNMGAGTPLGASTSNPNSLNNPGNTDTAWDGPYLIETTNSRPVPPAF
jgi:hypothetical protein